MRTYWNSRVRIKPKKRKLTLKGVARLLKRQERENSRSYLIKRLDSLFSEYLKRKSKGVCIKCGKVKLRAGVSHYYSRRFLSTRWLESNCVWSCWTCHTFVKDCLEHTKAPGDFYYELMEDKLGKEGFEKLNILAHSDFKISTSDLPMLIMDFENRLKNM